MLAKELTARLDELSQKLDAPCGLVSAGEMTREDEWAAYRQVEKALRGLSTDLEDTHARQRDSLLSYCLMRQSICARHLQQAEDELRLLNAALEMAERSKDEVQLARCLASFGLASAEAGDLSEGRALLHCATTLFTASNTYDHVQGLGWATIMRGDLEKLANDQPAAREAYLQAIAILKPIGNWSGVRRAKQRLVELEDDSAASSNAP